MSNAAHRPAQQSSISVPPSPLRSTFDSQRRQSEVISDSDYESAQFGGSQDPQFAGDLEGKFQCPRCTYANDPAMLSCEICEAPLISHDIPAELERATVRTESPGPTLQGLAVPGVGAPESIKISFRGGGEKIFHERLKGAMTQRKWLLQWAPPVPKPNELGASSSSSASPTANGTKTVGIAGLEARRNEIRKNNEIVIGSAFEDLETLMASAKEIIALAERFARQTNGSSSEASALIAQSASELGLVTKDMLGSGSNSESLYLSELSRNVAEFLTDDSKGVLRKAGGIISLVDLWAIFNRARGGVELVSPNDFEKAARLWEKLRLPVRLRQFKSGVLVVQASDRTDEKTIKALLAWLQTMHYIPPEKEVPWDWQAFGCGVTAQDAASHFGWSIGVATEELEMAEEKGVLCREESIEGLKFWENFIGTAATTTAAVDPILENLQLLGIG